MEGDDIELYEDALAAGNAIEGYDVDDLRFLGMDGSVYIGTPGRKMADPVALHRTAENQLGELISRLRSSAVARSIELPPGSSDDAQTIWAAIVAAEGRPRSTRGRHRR